MDQLPRTRSGVWLLQVAPQRVQVTQQAAQSCQVLQPTGSRVGVDSPELSKEDSSSRSRSSTYKLRFMGTRQASDLICRGLSWAAHLLLPLPTVIKCAGSSKGIKRMCPCLLPTLSGESDPAQ